jgi:hypothetical protein
MNFKFNMKLRLTYKKKKWVVGVVMFCHVLSLFVLVQNIRMFK